jgi:hypothetical protein
MYSLHPKKNENIMWTAGADKNANMMYRRVSRFVIEKTIGGKKTVSSIGTV